MKTHGFKKFTAMLSAIAMTASCFAAFAVPAGAAGDKEASTTVTQNATAAVLAMDNNKIKKATVSETDQAQEPTGIKDQIRMTAAKAETETPLGEDLGAAIGVFKLGKVSANSHIKVTARLYVTNADLSGIGLYTTSEEVVSSTAGDDYKEVMKGTALEPLGYLGGNKPSVKFDGAGIEPTKFTGTITGGSTKLVFDESHLGTFTYECDIQAAGNLYFIAGSWQSINTGTGNRLTQVVDISVEYSDTLENTYNYAPAEGTVNVLNDVSLSDRLKIAKNITISATEKKTITRDGTQGILVTTGGGLTLDNVNVTATRGTSGDVQNIYAVAVEQSRTLTIKNSDITGDIYQGNGDCTVNLDNVTVTGTIKSRKAVDSPASSTTCKISLTNSTHADAVKYYYNGETNDTLTMDASSSIGTLTIYGTPAAGDVVVKAADGTTLDPTKITTLETPNVSDKTYELVQGEGGLKLQEKAVKTPLEVTNPPTKKENLIYNGEDQDLLEDGGTAPEGGKMQYSLQEDTGWQDTPPTGKNAGEYNVYYKAVPTGEGEAMYTESAVGGPIQVTIAKAKPTFPEDAKTVNGGVYKDNMKLSDVSVPTPEGGTITWKNGETPLSAGNNQVQAEFTSNDDTNYEGKAEGTVTVHVDKATISSEAYTISGEGTFTAGTGPHTLTVAAEGFTVQYAEGDYSGSEPEAWSNDCPSYNNEVGEHKITVKLSKENYNDLKVVKTITITEELTITNVNVESYGGSSGAVYDTQEHDAVTVTGTLDGDTVTYYCASSAEDYGEGSTTAQKVKDAGTYYVKVTVERATYHPYEWTGTVTIAKADSTFPSGLSEVEVDWTDGMTLEDVTPPTTTEGKITWKDTTTAVTEGTAQYAAVFTPTDSSNYNTAEGEVTVNAVKKAAPTPTPVEESPATLNADVVAQLRATDDTWNSMNSDSSKFIPEGDSNENKIETTAKNHFGVFYSFGAVSLPEGATVTKATLSVYQGETKFSQKPFVVKKTDNPADMSSIEDVFNAAANAKNSGAEIGTTTMYESDDRTYRTEYVDVTNYFTEGERNSYLLYNADATDNNRQLSRKAELVIEFTMSAPEDNYVAEVIPADGGAGNQYETFKDAIAAVQEGETIKLLDDVTIDRMIFGSTAYSENAQDKCDVNNVTIDGGTHSITSDNSKDMLFEADNKTLTFKNVTLVGGKTYTINAKNSAKIHLQNVTITPASGKVGLNMSTQTTLNADSTTKINGLNYNNATAPAGGTIIVHKEGSTNLTTDVAGAFTYGVPETYIPGTLEVDGNGNLAVPAPAQQLTVETVPTAKDNLVYDGSEQELVNEGTASTGGKMQYSLSQDGVFTDDIPTGTDAKDYTVYYKAVAADSAQADKYIESEVGQVTVTIAKANITEDDYSITGNGTFKVGSGEHTLTVTAVGFTVQYAEGDYSASDPETWSNECPSYDGSTAGVHTITVKLSNKNYNDLKVVRTIEITDKEIITDVTVTAAANLVYTGAAQELVSVTGDNLGEYTITYYLDDVQQENVPTGTNAGEYKVKVTVERDGYSTLTWEQTVTIAKADIKGITVTGYTGDVDGEAHGVTINGDTTGYTVQYKTDDGEYSETAPTFKEAGEYTVTVKISRDNYNDLELTAKVTLTEVTLEPDYGFDDDYTPEEAPSGPTVYDDETPLSGWFSNNTDEAVTDHVVETKDGKLVMENNKADETVPSLWVGTQYADVEDAAASDRITITFEYTPGSADSRIYFVSANSEEIKDGVDGSTEGIYRTAGGANGLGMTPGMTYDITLNIDNSTHTGQFTVIPKGGVGISLMSILEPTDLPDGTNAVVFRPAAGVTDTIDNFSAELMSTSIAIDSVTAVQDGGYKASITATAADGAAVIAAVYRGGACVQVKFVSGGDVTFENAARGDVIKAFLWESTESMEPLAAPAQKTAE